VPAARRERSDVTLLLRAWRSGDPTAGEKLLERIYVELKRLAASQLRGERSGHTLQTTALVNEAYLRLLDQRGVDWRDRTHFFGLAATMMRRVLIDHARARRTRKRSRPEGDTITLSTRHGTDVELLDLDGSLSRLQATYPRQAKVVEMRYFADLEIEEIAVCLDVSAATVKRDWQFARAWLASDLSPALPRNGAVGG
jgi:RNA polymerase sigma factor (TIGR02999 family)